MNEIFTRRVHLPKVRLRMAKTKSHPEVRYSDVLCTLNNTGRFIKFRITEIKNTYKDQLKEFIIPEPEMVYEELTIHYRLIRHNKTQIDKDGVAWALKWIMDTLEEMGYVENDKIINFQTFATITDSSLPETMFEMRVCSEEERWEDK